MAPPEQFDFSFRERYLRGRLTANERATYEAALAADPALVAELRRHIQFSNWAGQELAAEPLAEPTISVRRRRVYAYRFPIAAAVLLALVAALAFLFWERSVDAVPASTPEQLFAEYYIPMPSFVSADRRGTLETPPPTDSLAYALTAYHQGDWPTAAAYFTALQRDSAQADTALFYLAMTELGRERYSTARTHLENYLDRYTTYAEDARWYLALTLLRLGQSDATRQRLVEIAAEDVVRQQKAETLLTQLPK